MPAAEIDSELPPLLLSLTPHAARPATVDYRVEQRLFVDKQIGNNRLSWRIRWYECSSAQDAGFRCFCSHCCCGTWVWNSAMKLVPGLEGEDRALGATIVAGALSSNSNNQHGASQAAAAAASAYAVYARSNVRFQLVNLLFPENRSETRGRGVLLHCCCSPCAMVQETDAVMTWAAETRGQILVYGPCTLDCACCELYNLDGYPARSLAPPLVVVRKPSKQVVQVPSTTVPPEMIRPPSGGRVAPAAACMRR